LRSTLRRGARTGFGSAHPTVGFGVMYFKEITPI
jgi:hypothetical protein